MAEKRTEKLTKTNKIKNTKELVFDIVVKDIKDYGYDEVTVRTICEKAEISTGMFYRLFGSKEGVLNYYYERMKMRFDQEVRPELENLTSCFAIMYGCANLPPIWEPILPSISSLRQTIL